jgi:hypothetical protein
MVFGRHERKPSSIQTFINLGRVTVPEKPDDQIAPGTKNSIFKQAGWK